MNFPSWFNKEIMIKANQVVFEDDFCHPDYRDRGLFTKINLYGILKAYEMGYREIIAIVLKENTPALKTQLRS